MTDTTPAGEGDGFWTRLPRLATLALAIGLPIVLVLAWYHGERRGG